MPIRLLKNEDEKEVILEFGQDVQDAIFFWQEYFRGKKMRGVSADFSTNHKLYEFLTPLEYSASGF